MLPHNGSNPGVPGGTPELPTLAIGWDATTHTVRLDFDSKDFKTWDFVLAILDMARQSAEQRKADAILAQRMAAVQQQQIEQQAVKRMLRG